jgi:hypothetical protein
MYHTINLPEDEPSGLHHRRHNKIKKLKIKIENMHVVGLYFIIDTNFVGLKLYDSRIISSSASMPA